jgi:hypothetical protein
MPRFFFDLDDGGGLLPDEFGVELPGLEAAEREGTAALVDIAKDAMSNGSTREVTLSVRDDSGQAQLVLKVTLAISRRGSKRTLN